MTDFLEFECRVPVDGYRVLVFDESKFCRREYKDWDDLVASPPDDLTDDERYLFKKWGPHIVPEVDAGLIAEGFEPEVREIFEPQSEKFRSFDLFEEASYPFVEFANTPGRLYNVEDAKALAERFGPLRGRRPLHADQWGFAVLGLRQAVKAWEKVKKETGDFGPISRLVSRQALSTRKFRRVFDSEVGRIDANILLRADPLSGAARLCIRPTTLEDALWAQLAQAITGGESPRACVQCKKWFTINSGHEKHYCSDACRMRAYRKRKGS